MNMELQRMIASILERSIIAQQDTQLGKVQLRRIKLDDTYAVAVKYGSGSGEMEIRLELKFRNALDADRVYINIANVLSSEGSEPKSVAKKINEILQKERIGRYAAARAQAYKE